MSVSQPKSRTGTTPHLVLCTLKLTRPRKNQVSFGRSKCDGCSIYFTLSYFIWHIHSFLVCLFTVLINVFRILSSPVFKVMSTYLEFYHTECSFTASYVTRARTIGKSLKSKNGKKISTLFSSFSRVSVDSLVISENKKIKTIVYEKKKNPHSWPKWQFLLQVV